jgi:molecular chaperone DnaK
MLAPAVEQGQRILGRESSCIIAATMASDQQEVWGRWASAGDRPDREERVEKAVSDQPTSSRDATRVPLAHRIQLKFDRFSGFINEYISNLSPGGIFIRTDSPELPGELLEFEFRLGDGFELIRGRGEVAWVRHQSEGPERPPGMGVRFIELSPGSKDLIYKIVDDHLAHGGKPFDLTPPPAAGAGVGAPPAAAAGADAPSVAAAGSGAPPAAAAGGDASSAAAAGVDASSAAAAGVDALSAATAGVDAPSVAAASVNAPSTAAGGVGAPAAAAAGGRDGPSDLPWTLDLPAIRPLPGVPAITPRSSLASLGGGGGVAIEPGETAGEAGTAEEGGSGGGKGAAAEQETGAPPGGGAARAAGKGLDPWAQMAAALPPLDELAPEVPVLPPASPTPQPAPRPSPTFSSFDLRAARRRSRLPLLGALVAVAALGLAAFLLRDSLLDWLERRGQIQAPVAPAAAPPPAPAGRPDAGSPAPVTPAPSGAGPRSGLAPQASLRAAPSTGTSPPAAAKGSPAASMPVSPAAAATSPAGAPAKAGPAAPAAPAAVSLTAVERITWEAAHGGTDVVLWGNGDFGSRSYSVTRLGGQPVRELVRVSGITRPFPSPRLAVRTPELLQIRTGYHPPQELHVVLDLGGRGVEVSGVEPGPRQLRIHLRGR